VYLDITLIAFIIDRVFGEFKYIKHPIILMGNFIIWFEKIFYKDTILRGFILTTALLFTVFIISFILQKFLPFWILSILASMGIASKMLYDSVKDIITNPSNIKYLVSRDTKELSNSDINKAAIETYGENLSDGVIAPIFYLLFFGFVGIFVYKAVNTLDSMVGYRNKRYENFGKVSAILDDIANYIPSRITAFLIVLLFWNTKAIKNIFKYASLHDSPNAGYPISAIAGICKVSLGGDTSYFGTIKKKSYFGDGDKNISTTNIKKALSFQLRFDIFLILIITISLILF
jgi:adenosylcobinamide-phosphate synthase